MMYMWNPLKYKSLAFVEIKNNKNKIICSNMIFALFVLLLLSVVDFSNAFRPSNEALYLSKYIALNQTDVAQRLSLVTRDGYISVYNDFTTHTGFLTVDHVHNTHLFFWFFPHKNVSKPLIVNIGSGTYDALMVNSAMKYYHKPLPVGYRPHDERLTNNNSVLYLDTPANTGFSYSTSAFAYDEAATFSQIVDALEQFMELFHQYAKAPVFILGSGNFVAHLALKMQQQDTTVNLKGLIAKNGFHLPGKYSTMFYELGLLDEPELELLMRHENGIQDALKRKDYFVMNLLLENMHGILKTLTGFENIDSAVNAQLNPHTEHVKKYLNRLNTRIMFHIPSKSYGPSRITEALAHKFLVDHVTENEMKMLLRDYRVLSMTGQLSLLYPYVRTQEFYVKTVPQYVNASRESIRKNGEIKAFIKQTNQFTDIVVINAGGEFMTEQPKLVVSLLDTFTHYMSFI